MNISEAFRTNKDRGKRQRPQLIIRMFKGGFSPSVAPPLYSHLIKGCPLQKPKEGVYIVPHLILQPPTPQELLSPDSH